MFRKKQKQLDVARPSLSKVAPLTATICWLYAFINLFVFLSLWFTYQPQPKLLIVNSILTFQVWATMFLVLGIIGTYSLLKNNWNMTRHTLLAGIVLKAAWEITLIFRTFQAPATLLITVMWGFFALVQIATYVYFLPEITSGRDNEQQPQR